MKRAQKDEQRNQELGQAVGMIKRSQEKAWGKI